MLSNRKPSTAKRALYLPLAVAQIAACISTSGMTLQEYQSPLSNAKDSIALVTGGRSHMHATALVVYAGWTWSSEGMESR